MNKKIEMLALGAAHVSIDKVHESRVVIENGEVKTIFSEEIQNNGGWMDIEESRRLTIEALNLLEREMRNGNKNTLPGL